MPAYDAFSSVLARRDGHVLTVSFNRQAMRYGILSVVLGDVY